MQNEEPAQPKKYAKWCGISGCLLFFVVVGVVGLIIGFLSVAIYLLTQLAKIL